jgi:hypothetical protein
MGQARIYYGDGTVSEYGPGSPVRNVQVILQPHPDLGWHTQTGYDYYVRRDGVWVGVDIFGLFDWLLDQGVLFGRTLTGRQYKDILNRAVKDLGGLKKGWIRSERQVLDG